MSSCEGIGLIGALSWSLLLLFIDMICFGSVGYFLNVFITSYFV